MSRLPFVTSQWFLLKVSIGSFIICLLCYCCVLDFDCLFLCFVTSLCFLLMVSNFPLFHYLFVASVLCSRLRLSHLLFVTALYFLLVVSIVSLSVCYVTMLSLQGFHCFIICLLRLSLPLLVSSLFIQAISVARLQANYHSEALQTQYTDVSEFYAEAPQATTRVKDLPKVPTWQLKLD